MRKCFNVRHSSVLQVWSRRSLKVLRDGGTGDVYAKLDAPVKLTGKEEKKHATVPPKQANKDRAETPRNHGNPLEDPLLTHGLPLSPLMDPRLIAARNRYLTPKPQPSGPPSALTMQLQKNPYGSPLH